MGLHIPVLTRAYGATRAGYWNRTTEWEVEEWVSGDVGSYTSFLRALRCAVLSSGLWCYQGITMRFISEQSDISEVGCVCDVRYLSRMWQ